MSLNLNTYTKDDINNRISVNGTGTKATFTGVQRNETAILFYDYGVDFFDTFTHEMLVTIDATPDSQSLVVPWSLANVEDDLSGLIVGDGLVFDYFRGGVGGDTFFLIEYDGGNLSFDSYTGAIAGNDFHVEIIRDATTLSAIIYTDATKDTIVDILSITLSAPSRKFGYHYAVQSWKDTLTVSVSGSVEDIDLGLEVSTRRTKIMRLMNVH